MKPLPLFHIILEAYRFFLKAVFHVFGGLRFAVSPVVSTHTPGTVVFVAVIFLTRAAL